MFQNICTRIERIFLRLGYPRKAAAPASRFISVFIVVLLGLFGLFFIDPEELYEPITGAGIAAADARSGTIFVRPVALRY
ncbi:MAG TPA: hypothetical protein PKM50_03580 [Methanoregula sp.]|nr:hypothetical protein [Methanoregula sp.]